MRRSSDSRRSSLSSSLTSSRWIPCNYSMQAPSPSSTKRCFAIYSILIGGKLTWSCGRIIATSPPDLLCSCNTRCRRTKPCTSGCSAISPGSATATMHRSIRSGSDCTACRGNWRRIATLLASRSSLYSSFASALSSEIVTIAVTEVWHAVIKAVIYGR